MEFFLKNKKIIILLCCFLGITVFAALHNVSKSITEEDQEYIAKIMKDQGYDWSDIKQQSSFEDEIQDIRDIQSAILGISKIQKQIPSFRTREPKDMFELRHAQCSDRSRVMDKAYRMAGFNSRIASVYKKDKTGSAIKSLLSHDKTQVRSHSVVEVQTSQGWMIVDTNDRWIALNAQNMPLGLEEWQNVNNKESYDWSTLNKGEIYWLMNLPYTYVYGLYSRHGYFYAPYNRFPDLNWIEMLQNF